MKIRLACMAALLLAACGATDEDGTARLRAFAAAEASCNTAADCCVVLDGCLATAYVVAASDYEAAREVAANLEHDACVACISPAVQLACEGGSCVGIEVDPTADSADERGDHCGAIVPPPQAALTADDGGDTGRILGCGG